MKAWFAFVVVCVLGVAAVAEDKPPSMVEVKARQIRGDQQAGKPVAAGDQIYVEARIIENKKDGSVLSAPRLTMRDGSQAQIAVGEHKADVQPGAGAGGEDPEATTITPGLKIDVTKPLGSAQVLVVTTILKDGKVVWTDARWSKVERFKP